MYDEAQEKFKGMKEEERFFFKIVKSKKRKGGKNEVQLTSSSGPFSVQSAAQP